VTGILQIDGQTSCHDIVRAYAYASRGKNHEYKWSVTLKAVDILAKCLISMSLMLLAYVARKLTDRLVGWLFD